MMGHSGSLQLVGCYRSGLWEGPFYRGLEMPFALMGEL